LPCPDVYQALTSYNSQGPDSTAADEPVDPLPWHGLNARQVATLVEFVRGSFDAVQATKCTSVWEDAWLVATADDLARGGGGGVVEVTTEGPIVCDYGELLLVSATRMWWGGRWIYGIGRDWTETAGGGLSVSGGLTFACEPVADPSNDLASVADQVPPTQVLHNPLVVGLTGLDTWYWYDFSQPGSSLITIETSIDAFGVTYPITATAWVDEVWWDPDCGADCDWRGMLSSYPGGGFDVDLRLDLADTRLFPAAVYDGGEGTEEGHAASYLYETKGDYVMATATIWRGVYTYEGVDHPYDPVLVSAAEPFQVCEVVGVLAADIPPPPDTCTDG
jgi:hypothetical protein